MGSDVSSVGDLLALMVKEGKRRILTLAAVFSVVALIGLAIAMLRAKKFECTATLLVSPPSVLATTAPRNADPALVTQIVLSRKILREVLTFGAWPGLDDPRVEDRTLSELKSRIRITNSRPELIRISYTDIDPERAFKITNKLTEIFIREAVAPTERETHKTAAILDKQVEDYRVKLAEAHEQVLAYYRASEARIPKRPTPVEPSPKAPITTPAPQVSAADLAALRAEEATLITELKRQEAPRPPQSGRDEQRFRERSQQLQAELDRLLTGYTEEHPDVKRLRRELDRVKVAEEQARADRETAEAAAATLDAEMVRATRARLDAVQRRIAALDGDRRPRPPGAPRVGTPLAPGAPQDDPELRLITRDSTMTELLRRYETTRDTFQDLLKKRENARVALQLAEESGLNLKVQEPAELPLTSISTRLMHVVAVALFLAGLAPLALLFAIVRLDPRVRSARQIQLRADVPFLGGIPFVPQYRDRVRIRRRTVLAAFMVVSVFAVYVAVFVMRMKASS